MPKGNDGLGTGTKRRACSRDALPSSGSIEFGGVLAPGELLAHEPFQRAPNVPAGEAANDDWDTGT